MHAYRPKTQYLFHKLNMNKGKKIEYIPDITKIENKNWNNHFMQKIAVKHL